MSVNVELNVNSNIFHSQKVPILVGIKCQICSLSCCSRWKVHGQRAIATRCNTWATKIPYQYDNTRTANTSKTLADEGKWCKQILMDTKMSHTCFAVVGGGGCCPAVRRSWLRLPASSSLFSMFSPLFIRMSVCESICQYCVWPLMDCWLVPPPRPWAGN